MDPPDAGNTQRLQRNLEPVIETLGVPFIYCKRLVMGWLGADGGCASSNQVVLKVEVEVFECESDVARVVQDVVYLGARMGVSLSISVSNESGVKSRS
mmetsp:Transcript_4782/g.7220  ORF Transcript_4782/g.7220 Transcript_4782/m.7220 type:complete len:98 (-) Transcript_4782:1762-2055(-)